MQMSILGDVLSKVVYSNVSQTPLAVGVWGQSSQPLGDFCKFLGKKSDFNPIGSYFARVQSHLKELDFLSFESQSKKFNGSILLLLAIKVQNTFEIFHCDVKF